MEGKREKGRGKVEGGREEMRKEEREGWKEGWGAYAREHASELTREYSVTGLLQHSLKSLLLALPAFISHLHITYFLSKLV